MELKASYSYLNLDLENKPGNTDTGTVRSDEGSSPRHEVVLRPLFNLPKRLEFDPAYRYVSALPAQSVKSYHRGFAAGWHFAAQMESSVVGQNLFQPQHAEFGGSILVRLVGIKRSVYAKIT